MLFGDHRSSLSETLLPRKVGLLGISSITCCRLTIRPHLHPLHPPRHLQHLPQTHQNPHLQRLMLHGLIRMPCLHPLLTPLLTLPLRHPRRRPSRVPPLRFLLPSPNHFLEDLLEASTLVVPPCRRLLTLPVPRLTLDSSPRSEVSGGLCQPQPVSLVLLLLQ